MTSDRRANPRAHGPYDAVRTGLLDQDVRLYDLGIGGCFVESLIEVTPGQTIRLRIELPDEGWITVVGVIIPTHRTLGYAVRFVELEETAREKIDRTVERSQSAT
jgi:hypothetical protein